MQRIEEHGASDYVTDGAKLKRLSSSSGVPMAENDEA